MFCFLSEKDVLCPSWFDKERERSQDICKHCRCLQKFCNRLLFLFLKKKNGAASLAPFCPHFEIFSDNCLHSWICPLLWICVKLSIQTQRLRGIEPVSIEFILLCLKPLTQQVDTCQNNKKNNEEEVSVWLCVYYMIWHITVHIIPWHTYISHQQNINLRLTEWAKGAIWHL